MTADTTLPSQVVRLTRTDDGIELYFPPFRRPGTALGLGVFGVIASVLPAVGIAALIPRALADSAGLMSAVLVAAFILPFLAFGMTCVLLAAYTVSNALLVRVDREGIQTWRMLFGVALKRHRLPRDAIAGIESQIAARDQSPFNAQPVYRLIARDRTGTRRVIIAESLAGETLMQQVKALVERARGENSNGTE